MKQSKTVLSLVQQKLNRFRRATNVMRKMRNLHDFYVHNYQLTENMSKKNQHVVPKVVNWGVRGSGNSKLTKIVATQKEAISVARKIAINKKSELVIHRPNSMNQDKYSYGNDPIPPRDTKH